MTLSPTQVTALDKLKNKAKALAAGLASTLAGELVLLASDAAIQSEVKDAVPPGWSFLVPILFGLLIGGITHQIPNTPLPVITPPVVEPPAAEQIPADPS